MDVNNLQLDSPSDIHTPVVPLIGESNKCGAYYGMSKGLQRARRSTPMQSMRRSRHLSEISG